MNTEKIVSVGDSKSFIEIGKGDVLRKGSELFIVTLLRTNTSLDSADITIHKSLFGNAPSSSSNEKRYDLVSIITGSRYFNKNMSLDELRYKLRSQSNSTNQFEIVDKIEYIVK